MSATTITILVGAICLLAGVVGGFFLARRRYGNGNDEPNGAKTIS